jgi:hypothetical protein
LAATGAILTKKFQNDENAFLHQFLETTTPMTNFVRNDTCAQPGLVCLPELLIITVDLDCSVPNEQCPLLPTDVRTFTFEFDNQKEWNETTWAYFGQLELFNLGLGGSATQGVKSYVSQKNKLDFSLLNKPGCDRWCDDDTWMFKLCISVAGLCVGISGLVFLYLYLGKILEFIYPRRRLERLANLLLMRGEEAPKLERVNTGSKSESIKPDLKEY